MGRMLRSGRLWVGLAALAWAVGSPATAWAGNGSSGGSSGGSHGSSGGSRGGWFSHGSSGGSSGGHHSHGSSGGSSGGNHSNGSSGGTSGGQSTDGSTSGQGASTSRSSAVLLTVIVPAEAKLFIEGQPTHLTGSRREFLSPRLESGRQYIYTLKAEVERGGQKVSGTEEFPVKAGDHATVEFGASALNPNVLVAGRR